MARPAAEHYGSPAEDFDILDPSSVEKTRYTPEIDIIRRDRSDWTGKDQTTTSFPEPVDTQNTRAALEANLSRLESYQGTLAHDPHAFLNSLETRALQGAANGDSLTERAVAFAAHPEIAAMSERQIAAMPGLEHKAPAVAGYLVESEWVEVNDLLKDVPPGGRLSPEKEMLSAYLESRVEQHTDWLRKAASGQDAMNSPLAVVYQMTGQERERAAEFFDQLGQEPERAVSWKNLSPEKQQEVLQDLVAELEKYPLNHGGVLGNQADLIKQDVLQAAGFGDDDRKTLRFSDFSKDDQMEMLRAIIGPTQHSLGMDPIDALERLSRWANGEDTGGSRHTDFAKEFEERYPDQARALHDARLLHPGTTEAERMEAIGVVFNNLYELNSRQAKDSADWKPALDNLLEQAGLNEVADTIIAGYPQYAEARASRDGAESFRSRGEIWEVANAIDEHVHAQPEHAAYFAAMKEPPAPEFFRTRIAEAVAAGDQAAVMRETLIEAHRTGHQFNPSKQDCEPKVTLYYMGQENVRMDFTGAQLVGVEESRLLRADGAPVAGPGPTQAEQFQMKLAADHPQGEPAATLESLVDSARNEAWNITHSYLIQGENPQVTLNYEDGSKAHFEFTGMMPASSATDPIQQMAEQVRRHGLEAIAR